MNAENKKILVIEDDPQILDFLIIALKLNKYHVISADNGADGYALAVEQIPDLIISDIMMPKMDGYELVQAIRNNPDTLTIPILLLSARSDKSDIRTGMNLGADDYLTKPFDIDDLLSSINSRLAKKRTIAELYSNKFENLRSSIRTNLPHEIRTPLNIIMGYCNILLNSNDFSNVEDVKEMLENISYGANRLHHLFENYLLYASLELMDKKAESKSSEFTTFQSASTIKEISESVASNNDRLDDLSIDVEDIPIKLSEYYFSKIIAEIIDNAFKFSDINSKVHIKSEINANYFIIIIDDKGRGMNQAQIASIGAYQQFDRELYEQQGAGLGLAITKKITDLFNCKLDIKSEQGNGTTVSISIPILE